MSILTEYPPKAWEKCTRDQLLTELESVRAERDDYQSRLRGSNQDYIKLSRKLDQVMTRCHSHNPGVDRPAAYYWYAQPSGNVVPLCVDCCVAWRRIAEAEPDLSPSRIESIPGANPFSPDPPPPDIHVLLSSLSPRDGRP